MNGTTPKPKSGFIDIGPSFWVCERKPRCHDRNHLPPPVRVPSGQIYQHVCPACGMVTHVHPAMHAEEW